MNTNTRCQVGRQAASEAEAGAVKAAPAGTVTKAELLAALRDIHALMDDARVFHENGDYAAFASSRLALSQMKRLIEAVQA